LPNGIDPAEPSLGVVQTTLQASSQSPPETGSAAGAKAEAATQTNPKTTLSRLMRLAC
jgi:hypothetical protein